MVQSPGEEIPQEELKKIFDRFYRLDKARAMDHSYGLGLSIAKSIVERHNGNIRAESGNGRNTFYVELPTI
jgi:signal transduction histidine kinase